jgi:glycosyltransferase involved in cell wall biosynthesis
MNICYLLTRSDALGGVQVHIKHLAGRLLDEGHTVTIIVGGKGAYYELLEKEKFNVISLKYLKKNINILFDVLALIELYLCLKRIKPDLISIHSSKAGVIGRLASSFLSVPSIFTAHGWAFTDGISKLKQEFYIVIERMMSHFCKRIITVSDYDLQLAIEKRISSKTKLSLVHNGMPEIEDRLLDKDFSKLIKLVMVARFDHQKDHPTLIDALTKLKVNNWSLDLIGTGPHEANIKERVKAFGLQDKVNFIGQVEDVVPYLNKSQIFLLISNWEGLPRSIIEAMRSGLPILASDVAGVKEMVEDGKNGYLIPRNNSRVLAEKIEYLLYNQEDIEYMAKQSLSIYASSFTFEKTFQSTFKIYKQLVELA